MDYDHLVSAVKRELKDERFQHTLRVVEMAKQLAKRFGADTKKAEIAAILHDYSKCWSRDTLRQWIMERGLRKDLLEHGSALWHAFVGAEAVHDRLGIEDQDILNAIRYHTTGRAAMTRLEKVIWLADYIEPGRQFPGLEVVRTWVECDLDRALFHALNNTILFLMKNDRPLHPLTVEARNDLLRRGCHVGMDGSGEAGRTDC